MSKQRMAVWIGVIATTLSWITAVTGEPISVNNASFETPILSENGHEAYPFSSGGWECNIVGEGTSYV